MLSRVFVLSVALGLPICISDNFVAADSPATATKDVAARTLKLKVPTTWEQVETTSEMRAAQFRIPGESDDIAELTVFYFGGPTGGVRANVERWIGQFDENDRNVTMAQGKCEAGRFIIVDATGTWNKPDGPPFAENSIATPGSRVINVIVIEEKDEMTDYYFMKLSGKKSLVSEQAAALRTAIGVVTDSEKPFELKDAEN